MYELLTSCLMLFEIKLSMPRKTPVVHKSFKMFFIKDYVDTVIDSVSHINPSNPFFTLL
jgi:hypothetical protein